LHPERLSCDTCGESVCLADELVVGLTSYQAVQRWPAMAETIKEHAVICTFRQNPGVPVFLDLMERE
jgi:hypothetical protein